MSIFKKNHIKDVLLLQPVRLTSEKRPRRKVRMLCCDASGRVFAALISQVAYEKARDNALAMKQRRKPFATIGLENGSGKYEPALIGISPEEAWALEHILEHALKSGKIPDILKKYLRQIIEHAESSIEIPALATPKVLDRLPYYPPGETEISVPIYKATYSYPLIVLKRLPPDEHTSHTDLNLLVLDSDGDLAAIRAPARLVRQAEGEIADNSASGHRDTCLLVSQHADGLAVSYMPISQPQKKALATLVGRFEASGGGKQPMPMAVRAVLSRAKERISAAAP
jgi:hypothetical protein